MCLVLVVDSFQFFIVGGTFVSFCFVTLVGVLAAILHIFVMVSFSRRYAPASDLLVVLGCFVLRRVRSTLKAVGSYGGSFAQYILLYGICVYIVRSHRGEVSHPCEDYSFTE